MRKRWLLTNRPKTRCGNDPVPVVGEKSLVTIWVGVAEVSEPAVGRGEPFESTATIIEVCAHNSGKPICKVLVRIGEHELFVTSDRADAWVNPEGACAPDEPLAAYLRSHGREARKFDPMDGSRMMPRFGSSDSDDVVLYGLPFCAEAGPRDWYEDGSVGFDLPYIRGKWNERTHRWEAIDYDNYEYEQ